MSKAQYKKGYKRGYNNSSQFDQDKLLKFNDDLTKGIVAGICQRAQDQKAGTVKFIFS